jgi:hypothetical protein
LTAFTASSNSSAQAKAGQMIAIRRNSVMALRLKNIDLLSEKNPPRGAESIFKRQSPFKENRDRLPPDLYSNLLFYIFSVIEFPLGA